MLISIYDSFVLVPSPFQLFIVETEREPRRGEGEEGGSGGNKWTRITHVHTYALVSGRNQLDLENQYKVSLYYKVQLCSPQDTITAVGS